MSVEEFAQSLIELACCSCRGTNFTSQHRYTLRTSASVKPTPSGCHSEPAGISDTQTQMDTLMLQYFFQPNYPIKDISTQSLTIQAISLDWADLPLHYSIPIYLILYNLGFLQATSFSPSFPSILHCSSPFPIHPFVLLQNLSAPPPSSCPIIGSSLYLKS